MEENRGIMASQLHRWRPALRRAVMKCRPEFFGWPPQQQERYGVAIPEDDRGRLDRALLEELFGYRLCSNKAAARAAERLSIDEQIRWNETILPLVGLGEDSFFLNEWLGDEETILDYESLRDFDERRFRFQEDARAEEDPAYVPQPYHGSLYLDWARLFVDERFTYVTLSMAAGYLSSEIGEYARGLIEQRIPHRYVPGRHHRKRDGESWQWDMRIQADGKEALLDALQEQVFRYERERYVALLKIWSQSGRRGVFVLDTSEPPERNVHLVFSDAGALEVVRFRSFMRDVRAIELSAAELAQALEDEKKILSDFVAEQYESLSRSVDPSVVRLRRRRRVLVHKNAFDGLS